MLPLPDGGFILSVGPDNGLENIVKVGSRGQIDAAFKPFATNAPVTQLTLSQDGKILVLLQSQHGRDEVVLALRRSQRTNPT